MPATAATFCCDRMRETVEGRSCPDHARAADCPDALISRFSTGEFGIIVHDGGSSHIIIDYCPWCGAVISAARAVPDED